MKHIQLKLIHIVKVFVILTMLFLTTACWSSREIEDLRAYLGIGIDVADETKFEKEVNMLGGHYPKKNILTATVQVVPGVYGRSDQSQNTGSQTPETFFNEKLTGDSIFQIFRQFSLRRDRPIIGHHLKVVVVSRALCEKYGLEKILDFFLRDNDIRPSALILISQEKAMDVLSSSQPGEIPALNLKGLVNNRHRTNRILPPVSLSRLEAYMQSKRSFILQNVITAENEIKFSGAAIFKGEANQWIGQLNQTDLESISYISGTAKGGVLKTYDPENGQSIVYEVKSADSVITPKVEGDKISFHVSMRTTGEIMEDWSEPDRLVDEDYMNKLTTLFKKQCQKQIDETLYKLQNKYRVDVVEFGNQLRIDHPKVWNRVKDHWDEVFSTAPITYDLEVDITDYGSAIH
ncbi:Ger(x)C family spore germination protein [Paenibacillus sp. Marseille-Q4541]|uniref:Ger(x)C family spore germination protein n=1 Tax=Paenibacillus sp. Marseille-Q4541 TaxID=2831522 RepID=UPI001BA70BE5|nr:Ger(x)C family spore germination protein [Paenibacillus sp. Marseille-Q4541]